MDFNPSEMQQMLLDSAERFLGDHYTLEHRRSLRAIADGVDRVAWAAFAELGWLALAIPEAHGGLGGSMEDVALLSAALGGKLVTEPFAGTAIAAVHILAGADAPRQEQLDAIAAGSTLVSLAHGEPGERYSHDGPRATMIERSGNALHLSGQKMLVLDAPSADLLIVSVGLVDSGDPALVMVDARAKGVTLESYPLLDGSRAADVRFDRVALEADAILCAANRAGLLLAEAIDRATLSLAAQSVGSMEACLEICAAYLKVRQQFGQVIGKFQSLQHIMADMFVATHQARSALYQALSRSAAAPAERGRALSLARLTIGEAAQLVSRQAIQLHGGYGITDEYEVSHHYRRLLVIEKLYGDLDHHARRVATA